MTNQPAHWPSFLHELDASERAWNTRQVRYSRPDAVPMLPYPTPMFASLLLQAVMVAPPSLLDSGGYGPSRFLDVGAGPGAKVRLAAALFGLDARGIDIVPQFSMEARAHGADVEVADAFDYDGYADAEIIYVNRPSTLMEDLEKTVMDGMKPGAVLMMVNGRSDPGRSGWVMVTQEYGEPSVGCWIKP